MKISLSYLYFSSLSLSHISSYHTCNKSNPPVVVCGGECHTAFKYSIHLSTMVEYLLLKNTDVVLLSCFSVVHALAYAPSATGVTSIGCWLGANRYLPVRCE